MDKERKRLLIADDNVEHRTGIARALSSLADADFASHTDEGIQMARENSYTLIITDGNMEDAYKSGGGERLVRKVREFDQQTPIIYNSAYFGYDKERTLRNIGANEVILKTDRSLIETLQSYLSD